MSCGYFFYGNCINEDKMHCFYKNCPLLLQEKEDKFIKEKK